VWTVATQPYAGAHFAVMPPKLVAPCILAGCPEGGTVLDPFVGSGTVIAVAQQHGRSGVGIDLNPEYLELARERIERTPGALFATEIAV
jgi:DNA modification methylase